MVESFLAAFSMKMVIYLAVLAGLQVRGSVWRKRAKASEASNANLFADNKSLEEKVQRLILRAQKAKEDCDCANKKVVEALATAASIRSEFENRASAILLAPAPANPIDLLRENP